MKYGRRAAMCILLLCGLLLCGCDIAPPEDSDALISAGETWAKDEDGTSLRDTMSRYEGEDDPPVVTLYLTVGRGNAGENTDHTWTEVNETPLTVYDERGIEPYACEAVLQVGDENGPVPGEFGYGERAANATVRLRGRGASRQPQKSYRIAIKQGKGEWEDQKTIVLSKHVPDPLRFKNRLGYALMRQVPGLFSSRTRFVHLYVKDKTEGEDGLFEDYGLYTQVEQPNKTYLKAHGLDKDGALYQAEHFDWARHEDALRLATDPDFSQDAFEEYLEIEGGDDHTKLLELLDAVNDMERPISQVVEDYFDSENLYNWLAFQILTGNRDAADGGYYLYSPQLVDRWIFLSWNNDGMLSDAYERLKDPEWTSSWDHGIFSFTQNVLFGRMMRDEQCRAALDGAVEALLEGCLSESSLSALAEAYAEQVKPYVYALPDRLYARVDEQDYDELVGQLAAEVEVHAREYRDSLNEPWPFHILSPESTGDGVILRWEESYLYEGGETVSYTVELARSPAFDECVLCQTTDAAGLNAGALAPGQYFLRVRAQTPSGASQDAFEAYYAESGATIHSTICFYVTEDGGVTVSRFDGED